MASKGSRLVRSRAALTARKLGGKSLLGVAVRSEADLIPMIERGLPLASLSALTQDAITAEEVDRLIVPRRTLSHRRAKNQPLSRIESERAVRVASIIALAEDTLATKMRRTLGFGDRPLRFAANVRSTFSTTRWGRATPQSDRVRHCRLIFIWRLTKRRNADLSGRGGELEEGRWNTRGRRLVYCAGTASLAVLEVRPIFDSERRRTGDFGG
jgi:uncharacterized protein (DUF2384 family)